jgi:hypothetical protein
MLLRTLLALFLVVGASAQQTSPAEPAQKRDDAVTRAAVSPPRDCSMKTS